MNRISAKIKSGAGFTMTEMLVTILIMSLVTVGLAYGVTAAGRSYKSNMQAADANTLCSSIAVNVLDELRYATDITGSGTSYSYDSAAYGNDVRIEEENGKIVVGDFTLGAAGIHFKILPDKAYGSLYADSAISYDSSRNTFSVTVSVCRDLSMTDVVRSASFTVKPVNY